MARNVFAPLFWISAMIGRTFAAWRSALPLRAVAPASRAAEIFGLPSLLTAGLGGAQRPLPARHLAAPHFAGDDRLCENGVSIIRADSRVPFEVLHLKRIPRKSKR